MTVGMRELENDIGRLAPVPPRPPMTDRDLGRPAGNLPRQFA
jgi:hypothetical protein